MPTYETITSANSILTLAIANLFPVPQQLQGFSAETGFTTEAFESVEVVMGVDANMSAGWVPVVKKMTIQIMPDSPSNAMFDAWYAAQQAARELYFASGEVVLPAVSRTFTMIKGVLSTYTPIPEMGKVLKARTFGLTFQDILPAPI